MTVYLSFYCYNDGYKNVIDFLNNKLPEYEGLRINLDLSNCNLSNMTLSSMKVHPVLSVLLIFMFFL